jgi:hypothetical protein
MLLIKMFTPSGRCWIFLYGYQHLYLYHLWLLLYIQLNVELFIDACDKELLMWNLTREICTRGAEDVFCWNTVEEQVEIDSTGMFIMYIHVWPRCSTMEELGLFCRIGSAGRCSTWLDWNWSHIYNWSWYMTDTCVLILREKQNFPSATHFPECQKSGVLHSGKNCTRGIEASPSA